MPRRELWALLLVAMLPVLLPASVDTNPAPNTGGQASLAAREHRLRNVTFHDSEFATLVHNPSRTSCSAAEPPQALATPDPLLEEPGLHSKISVSFIIGTDGRVHSPLILESAGPSGDRTILDAVRFWRYRPARCNGVPTDAEAKVEFSSR